MAHHINIIGILYIVFGVLGILAGLLIFMVLGAIGAFTGDETAFVVLGIVGTGLALIFLITAIPGIIGGVFLMKRREWARILVLILAFFNLLNIPLGTILGIYTIWALMNQEMVQLFQPGGASASPVPPQPPSAGV